MPTLAEVNARLHETFEASTHFRKRKHDNGEPCGCIFRYDGINLRYCGEHSTKRSIRSRKKRV